MIKISKEKNIKLGTAISFIGVFVSLISHFLFTPFLLKTVGQSNYGIYSFVANIAVWFTLAINSLSSSYIKFYSKYTKGEEKIEPTKINGIFNIILTIYSLIVLIIGAVLVILIFNNIIFLNGYSTSQKDAICIMLSISTLTNFLSIGLRGFTLNISYNSKFVWLRSLNVLVTVINSTVPIPFLLSGCGILTISIVTSCSSIFVIILDIFYSLKFLNYRSSFKNLTWSKKIFSEILIFTGIALVNEISVKINASLDGVLLGFKAYDNEVAIYQLGFQLVTYAAIPVTLISQNYSPTISDNITNGNFDSNNKIFEKISFVQSVLWLMLVGGFASCGKEFVSLWLGEGYENVYWITLILLIIETITSTTTSANTIEILSNKHLGRSLIVLGTTITNLLISIVLINLFDRQYAIICCLVGTCFSYFFGYWLAMNIYHKKSVNLPIGKYLINLLFIFLVSSVSFSISYFGYQLIKLFTSISTFTSLLFKGSVFIIIFLLFIFLIFRKKIIMYIKFREVRK